MSSQNDLENSILNTIQSYADFSQHAFRVDQTDMLMVPNVLDQWRQNFQYALGPTNPAFVDATLSHQDILVWGYTLQYNQNGVLWRVDPAGRPHPDDYRQFLEQNRILQKATERTIAEIEPLLANLQAGEASSQSQPNPAESSAAIKESGRAFDTNLNSKYQDSLKLFDVSLKDTFSTTQAASQAETLAIGQYGDEQKAQYYLANLGFNIGKNKEGNPIIDGDLGVLSSSSLIIFQHKAGLKITGKADSDTLTALSEYAQRGMSLEDIMSQRGRQLAAYADGENGRLDVATLTRIPTAGGQDAYLFESAAVAWAKLVQAVAREAPHLNLNAFLARGPISGYRDFLGQVEMWDFWEHDNRFAAIPGTSIHGLGLAIDVNISDARSGIATSSELKWLEKNAARFGFRPYGDEVNGVVNYVETWHWDYKP